MIKNIDMVKLDLTGCDPFVAKEQYNEYLKGALLAQKEIGRAHV